MATPDLLQVAFAHLLLASIFVFGTYSVAYLLSPPSASSLASSGRSDARRPPPPRRRCLTVASLSAGVKLTRFLFWAFVAMVYVGAVLPPLLVVAGFATMHPAVPSGNLLALAANIGLSTLVGTVYGVRQWRPLRDQSGE